jgi:hypothetical protein
MMNTTKNLLSSWDLMLRYRALWIFGIILALTTVSFGSALWLSNDEEPANQTLVNWEISPRDRTWIKENFGLELPLRYTLTVEDLAVRLDDPSLSMQERARLLRIAVTILAVLLVLWAVTLVLRYTAQAALITMVNDQQKRDKKYSAHQGWSLGFSTAALKLFLIDLVGFVLLLLLTPLLGLPALLPVLIAVTGSPTAISVGVLLMVSLMLASVAALIILWIAGPVTLQLARRASCLEGLGIFASLWRGIHLMRTQLRGVGLTWLVIVGLDLVYPILAAPIGILLAAAGLAVSGLLALILGALLALVLAQTTAWTIAVIAGLVLLALVVLVPLTLMGGLREVFKSSAWTLTFGEAVSDQKVESAPTTQSAVPQVAAA